MECHEKNSGVPRVCVKQALNRPHRVGTSGPCETNALLRSLKRFNVPNVY